MFFGGILVDDLAEDAWTETLSLINNAVETGNLYAIEVTHPEKTTTDSDPYWDKWSEEPINDIIAATKSKKPKP